MSNFQETPRIKNPLAFAPHAQQSPTPNLMFPLYMYAPSPKPMSSSTSMMRSFVCLPSLHR